MPSANLTISTARAELWGLLRFLTKELKPRGKMLTPFNVVSVPIILLGAALLVIRFTKGLGSITNLSQDHPWGLWIGFDVITGVAFAGGAYVLTFMVYVLRLEKYHPIVRVTVLNSADRGMSSTQSSEITSVLARCCFWWLGTSCSTCWPN